MSLTLTLTRSIFKCSNLFFLRPPRCVSTGPGVVRLAGMANERERERARTSLISSSIDQTVMISDTRTKCRMILCRRASFLAPSALRCAARLPCASQLPPLAALQPTLAWGSRSSSTKSNEGAAAPVDDTKPKLMFEGAKNKIVKTLKLASIANLGFAVAAGTPALAPCHEFSAHSPSVSVPQSRSCSTSPLRQVRAARVWR